MREFDFQSSNTPLFKSMGTFDRNLNWPGKLYYIREQILHAYLYLLNRFMHIRISSLFISTNSIILILEEK